jgi:hypothetical protein
MLYPVEAAITVYRGDDRSVWDIVDKGCFNIACGLFQVMPDTQKYFFTLKTWGKICHEVILFNMGNNLSHGTMIFWVFTSQEILYLTI